VDLEMSAIVDDSEVGILLAHEDLAGCCDDGAHADVGRGDFVFGEGGFVGSYCCGLMLGAVSEEVCDGNGVLSIAEASMRYSGHSTA
jgi:hypothetical protein